MIVTRFEGQFSWARAGRVTSTASAAIIHAAYPDSQILRILTSPALLFISIMPYLQKTIEPTLYLTQGNRLNRGVTNHQRDESFDNH
jgi:hypothetical protein